jgi:replicative DNA helicase
MNGSIRNYPEQAERFMEELRYIARLPVKYLDDAKTLDDVMGFLSSNHTAWWGMDHIQTCPYMPGKPNDGDVRVLTVIANNLAAVAKSVAPGLVLAHTPREVDKREDRRPRLGDIKGSSSIEGAARVVLGAYTDRIYQKVPPEELNRPYMVELQVLKNNNGPGVGQVVDLMFHPKTGQFDDVSELAETPED